MSSVLTSVMPQHGPVDGCVTLPEAGRSWVGMHGGLVVSALVDRAARETGRIPAAVTAHLHAAVDPGSATITATTLAAGRSVTSVTTALEQGRRRATASVVLAAAVVGDARQWPAASRDLSDLPEPEAVPRLDAFDDLMPVARHLDIRPVRGSGPFGGADEPALTAWVRLLPAEPYREAVAPVLLDALAPSLYAVLPTPVAIPTVEFTVHLTPVRPPGEWFLVDQRTTWSTASFCVDEGTLHTPDGTLVAQSRQLRRVLG